VIPDPDPEDPHRDPVEPNPDEPGPDVINLEIDPERDLYVVKNASVLTKR
jgi:hypothetical protein